jgi:hypothetical protein
VTSVGLGAYQGTLPKTVPWAPSADVLAGAIAYERANARTDAVGSAASGVADRGFLRFSADFAAVLADATADGTADIEASDMPDAAQPGDAPQDARQPSAAEQAAVGRKASLATMLADAMKEETALMGVTAGAKLSGMATGYPMSQGQGIEQAILAAASTGEVSDAQIALMMLCTMMQSSENSDFSILMQMMAAMLTRVEGDAEALRSDVMASEHSPYVLDTIDREVFHTRIPDSSSTGEVILPLEVWRPAIPVLTNAEGERSAELYRTIIDQFNVEKAPRYRPYRNGYTYCNIFVWDVTSAMGAEIPHYTEPSTGEPRYYPDIKGTNQLGAIAIDEWLRTKGQNYGWLEVDAKTAQRYANEGKPAVTTAGHSGHVQIVCPSEDGEYDEARGAAIAQAGSKVRNYAHISDIYGNGNPKSVRYFVHE